MHFRNFAPEPKEYAVNRYTFEAQRHWGILEARLGKQKYMVGDAYGIVDMAVWGWSRLIPFVLGPEAPTQFPNLQRHLAEISARPAAQKALALKDKYTFKTEMDEAARSRCSRILRRRWPDRSARSASSTCTSGHGTVTVCDRPLDRLFCAR